jgi:hypothetical protein
MIDKKDLFRVKYNIPELSLNIYKSKTIIDNFDEWILNATEIISKTNCSCDDLHYFQRELVFRLGLSHAYFKFNDGIYQYIMIGRFTKKYIKYIMFDIIEKYYKQTNKCNM